MSEILESQTPPQSWHRSLMTFLPKKALPKLALTFG